MPALTPEEIKNGWDEASLAEYLRSYEQDRVEAERPPGIRGEFAVIEPRVPGLVVTEHKRLQPPVVVENATSFDPHKWRR